MTALFISVYSILWVYIQLATSFNRYKWNIVRILGIQSCVRLFLTDALSFHFTGYGFRYIIKTMIVLVYSTLSLMGYKAIISAGKKLDHTYLSIVDIYDDSCFYYSSLSTWENFSISLLRLMLFVYNYLMKGSQWKRLVRLFWPGMIFFSVDCIITLRWF